MIRKVIALIRRLRQRLELSSYDDFTIGQHFRSLGAQIGEDNRLQIRTLGSEPWLVRIGNHCTLSTDVMLLTHDGAGWVFTDELPSLQKFGPIDIRDNCFIGARAIIMPNIRIGPNSIVGTGAVVTRDVPPNTVVAGCPAKKVCDLSDYKAKVTAAWETQRPPTYLEELAVGTRHPAKTIHAHKLASNGLLRTHLTKLFWQRD